MGADREVETALAVSILSTLQDYGVESFVQHVAGSNLLHSSLQLSQHLREFALTFNLNKINFLF
jgi:hypothetical protein